MFKVRLGAEGKGEWSQKAEKAFPGGRRRREGGYRVSAGPWEG